MAAPAYSKPGDLDVVVVLLPDVDHHRDGQKPSRPQSQPDRAEPGPLMHPRADGLDDRQRHADAHRDVAEHPGHQRIDAEAEEADVRRGLQLVPELDLGAGTHPQREVDETGHGHPEGGREQQPPTPSPTRADRELADQQRRAAVQRDEEQQGAQ